MLPKLERSMRTAADLLAVFLFVFGKLGLLGGFFVFHAERFFELPNRFAQPLSDRRKAFRPKDKKGDCENEQQMHRLQETFEHFDPPNEHKLAQSLQQNESVARP